MSFASLKNGPTGKRKSVLTTGVNSFLFRADSFSEYRQKQL